MIIGKIYMKSYFNTGSNVLKDWDEKFFYKKFKLGTEIDSLTELINNRINVQANVRKRNDLETQITECNDAIISYTNLLSKTKSDWDTFESNNLNLLSLSRVSFFAIFYCNS